MIVSSRLLVPHKIDTKCGDRFLQAETLFGILLVLGWQTRTTAFLSGVLLLLFAVTMTVALGIKAPLDASVFSAAGGAFLLANCAEYPFSIDQLRRY